MPAEVFLDTSIFVHQLEALDVRKGPIADGLIRTGIASGNACISDLVIQECLNTALQVAEVPLDTQQARRYLDAVLSPLLRTHPAMALYHRALDIESRYGYAFRDGLIIAAALESGCGRLYSEALGPNRQIDFLELVNPFGYPPRGGCNGPVPAARIWPETQYYRA